MITTKDRIYNQCKNKAISFIAILKNESPVTIERQLPYDNILYNSVTHLAHMYFEFETNECLRDKNELTYFKYKQSGMIR